LLKTSCGRSRRGGRGCDQLTVHNMVRRRRLRTHGRIIRSLRQRLSGHIIHAGDFGRIEYGRIGPPRGQVHPAGWKVVRSQILCEEETRDGPEMNVRGKGKIPVSIMSDGQTRLEDVHRIDAVESNFSSAHEPSGLSVSISRSLSLISPGAQDPLSRTPFFFKLNSPHTQHSETRLISAAGSRYPVPSSG
jgi:hypothetical protein